MATRRIPLTKGKYTLVDDEDYKKVTIRKWSYHRTGYAVGGYPQVGLHRFIMGAPKGKLVDHINGDKLDNRKVNLRLCTSVQNQHNSRKLDGVHYRADRNAWIVRMNLNGIKRYIGYFKSYGDAVAARKSVSKKEHGRFSPYV